MPSHKSCIRVSNIKVFFLTDPPSVTLSVQPQTVTEGAKVLFICSASANPEITGYRYPSFILISISFHSGLATMHTEPVVKDDDTVQSYNHFKTLYAANMPTRV